MKQRTQEGQAFGVFLLLASPVGIFLAIALAPVAIPLLIAYFCGLVIVWVGTKAFTHFFVSHVDPVGYNLHQQSGGDVFVDSLGTPLNWDQEDVRTQGTHPNTECPNCGSPMIAYIGMESNCPNPQCSIIWAKDDFWIWCNDSQYHTFRSIALGHSAPSAEVDRDFWTGEDFDIG